MILEKIEEKANATLTTFGAKKTPVPIEEIASKLGIKISRGPSKDFSGILIRKDGSALIGVNSSEAAVRQRFTIAHELGHYYLHPKKDTFIDYRDNKKDPKRSPNEREADMFAAALLMPREQIEKDFRSLVKTGFTDYEIQKLAEHYQVSEMAMKLRVLNLNLSL
jgi:Zn-dependent peptidase ImmA (M78 family)